MKTIICHIWYQAFNNVLNNKLEIRVRLVLSVFLYCVRQSALLPSSLSIFIFLYIPYHFSSYLGLGLMSARAAILNASATHQEGN